MTPEQTKAVFLECQQVLDAYYPQCEAARMPIKGRLSDYSPSGAGKKVAVSHLKWACQQGSSYIDEGRCGEGDAMARLRARVVVAVGDSVH